MKKEISILDYGMGNIGSIVNVLEALDYKGKICTQPDDLMGANAIILPGVGAFPSAMKNLSIKGFLDPLNEVVLRRKTPFLGICLGLQLIAEDSMEQKQITKGLSWIEGHVVQLEPKANLPVPHVGWNSLTIRNKDCPVLTDISDSSFFYFDHSYHLKCPEQFVQATCDYGGDVVSVVQRGNIFAAQFHPEKSQRSGLKLLRSFLNYVESQEEKGW